MAGPSRKTWSWIWSAVSSQARTPMKASGVGSGSTPAKRTPAAVLRPTRIGRPRRECPALPRHRTDRVVEPSRVVATGQPIPTGTGFGATARRQVRRAQDLVEDDGVVAHGRPDDRAPIGAQRVEQPVQIGCGEPACECPGRRSARWSPRLLFRSGEEVEELGPGGGQAPGDRVEHARQDRRGESGVRLECGP